MSIRAKNKDHRDRLAPPLASVQKHIAPPVPNLAGALRFTTQHPDKPGPVDLLTFSAGQREKKAGAKWNGPLSGRPELIQQLAPAIYDEYWQSPKTTVGKFLNSLRRWWRLFDALEQRAAKAGGSAKRIDSVAMLSELHGQAALDANFSGNVIGDLRRVVNLTRQALGLRQLHWAGPEASDSKRHLPPPEKVRLVWHGLKRQWLQTLDRWDHATELLAGHTVTDGDERLLRNYRRFEEAMRRVQKKDKPFPTPDDIRHGLTHLQFSRRGLHLQVLYAGFYPTPVDVRMAFHLCLASTGWNPQTMLDLPVSPDALGEARTPYLETHPQDNTRYILRGYKTRGKSEHVVYGDWKTARSPGVILRTLVERTWPLRQALQRDLAKAKATYEQAMAEGLELEALDTLRLAVAKLQEGVRSPWLYCTAGGAVEWLTDNSYRIMPSGGNGRTAVLKWLVDLVNVSNRLEGANRVPYIVAGDFRDAFAAFVWKATGGSVLHVMQALGHRRLKTSFTYLNNTVLNQESVRIFRTFSNALWQEIRVTKRLDPTILAKATQDANVSEADRQRLGEYRNLKRSRIGVGCRDSFNPPRSIAPDFVPDGKAQCPVQRCTLCLEHAVILPDSLDGLAMRFAELDRLREHMSVEAFIGREFQREHENTEAALAGFDALAAAQAKQKWRKRIEDGEHRVIEFHGAARRTVGA